MFTKIRSYDDEQVVAFEIPDAKKHILATGSLFLTLHQDNRVVLLSNEQLHLPKDFTTGNILISQIATKNLLNKELMGSQDPYLILSYGDWESTTSTKTNGGSNVIWKDLKMNIEVNTEMLQLEKLQVKVKDENLSRNDVVLGTGSCSLLKATQFFNQVLELTIDLTNEGKTAGSVTISCCLTSKPPNEVWDMIPNSAISLTKGMYSVKMVKLLDVPKKKGFGLLSDNKVRYVVSFYSNENNDH